MGDTTPPFQMLVASCAISCYNTFKRTNNQTANHLPPRQMIALTSIKQATSELTRLEGIRNNLAGLIVELQESNNPSASTWVSIYSSRLQENVLPALKETREYLKSASLLVPGTHGRHS